MSEAAASEDTHEIAFEAFGVRIGLSANDAAVLERLREFVPPSSQPCDPSSVEQRFSVIAEGNEFDLRFGESWNVEYGDLDFALGLLDQHMSGYIAVNAPERIFVHAGVVAHHDRVLVMPGMSFAGKSSLVAALVRAGATYYSDEFAVLDEAGRVHPYPKPISIRDSDRGPTTHTAESLGGTVGEEPRPPSAIVLTSYRPGAEWAPRRLSSGEGVLGMLSNTVPARERPAESLRALTSAVEGAIVLEGDRGEADELAPRLLADLEASLPSRTV